MDFKIKEAKLLDKDILEYFGNQLKIRDLNNTVGFSIVFDINDQKDLNILLILEKIKYEDNTNDYILNVLWKKNKVPEEIKIDFEVVAEDFLKNLKDYLTED